MPPSPPAAPFLRRLAVKAVADRIGGLAAEVAFWSLVSLVPAALVLATLLGLVESVAGSNVSSEAEARVVDILGDALGSGGDGVVRGVEALFTEPRPGLFSVALLLALWSGSRVMASITDALDVIGGFHERRSWLLRRLWGVALGLGSLVVVTGVLVVLVVLPVVTGPLGGSAVGGVLVGVVAAAIVVLWVSVVFSMAASRRRRFRDEVRGAALAAALVMVFTTGFRLYLTVQADNVVVFSLGGVLVALLWLYLLGLALLIGAVANEVWLSCGMADGAPAPVGAYAGGRDND